MLAAAANAVSNDLFTMGVPIAEKAIRTAAVYVGLLVLIRLAGKRDLAQLNTFDFVVLLLLSNVVQNAVIGADDSLIGGLVGAAILVVGNAALVRAAGRSDRAVRVLEGTPTVVVRDGEVDMAAVHRLGLRPSDVVAALRRQGADEIAEVAQASLEPGGTISVLLKDEAMTASRADVARLEAKVDALLARL
jgi:uncharacterized membrane protein YcaP (DUF421 family)